MFHKLRAFGAVATLLLALTAAFYVPKAKAQATQVPPAMVCFQATTGVSGLIGVTASLVGGSGGTSGVYVSIPLTGGSGTGATANFTIAGGVVTQVVIANPGLNYQVGDVLSATASQIGNTSGFSVTVASISINSSLAGGSVGMYQPGTLNLAQTWKDSGQATLNTNPIMLDANGCALIYGVGTYRQIVYDNLGNVVWDRPTSVAPVNPYWAGTAGGTANAITVTDGSFAGTDGQSLEFLASATNTGPVTLNPSGYGPISLVKNSTSGPVPLTGSEIIAGNLVVVTYSAAHNEFIIQNPSADQSSASTVITCNATYGCDPTGVTDNTSAFLKFWSACNTLTQSTSPAQGGNECFIPAGHYKFTQNLLFDLSLNQAGGFHLYCGGNGGGGAGTGALLDFTSVPETGLTMASSIAEGVFYGVFDNCGILANNPGGAALQFGQSNYSDALNGFQSRNLWVKNLANVSGSEGTVFNEVYDSVFDGLTSGDGCPNASGNCPTSGDGIRLRQSSFNTFNGGSYSSSQNGIAFTDGYSFGNVFNSPDLEVDYNDVQLSSVSASDNTINGGQFVWCATGSFPSCAGAGGFAVSDSTSGPLVLNNNNLANGNNNLVGGAGAGNVLITGLLNNVTTPSFPSSGTAFANGFNRRVNVQIYNGTITQICTGIAASNCATVSATGALYTVGLGPADSIKVTYTGGPGWFWEAAQ
jgi:hypothetical protein